MNWPQHLLPNPTENYSVSSDPFLSRTEFEIGFRQRRRFTHVEDLVQVSWDLNQFQMDVFEAFVQRTLQQGSQPVTMELIGLEGIRALTVRFVGGSYSKQYVSVLNYRVTATLRCEPKELANPVVMDILLNFEDTTVEEFIELSNILYLYLNSYYGDSSVSPEITQYLASH